LRAMQSYLRMNWIRKRSHDCYFGPSIATDDDELGTIIFAKVRHERENFCPGKSLGNWLKSGGQPDTSKIKNDEYAKV
jgi:hypothetical protein